MPSYFRMAYMSSVPSSRTEAIAVEIPPSLTSTEPMARAFLPSLNASASPQVGDSGFRDTRGGSVAFESELAYT